MFDKLSISEQRGKLRQLSDSLDEITRQYCSLKNYKGNDKYFLEKIDTIRLELLSLKNGSKDHTE